MGREAMIRADMEAAGTYNPIFDKSIKDLAKRERELAKVEKAWRAAYCVDGVQRQPQMVATLINKQGLPYQAKDPFYAEVCRLRKEIDGLRSQLGLTPKSLNRVRETQRLKEAQTRSRLEMLLDDAHEYAVDHAADWAEEVDAYVDAVLSGEKIACLEIRQACQRYRNDLASGRWDFRTEDACEIIAIIETTCKHRKGEALDGSPMRGRPFLLLPYHKFIVFNIMGFFVKGTTERRFKEALDYIPRKNIKTTFAASLAWALGLYQRRSGSTVYIVGGALKQAKESLDFLKYNIRELCITLDDDPVSGLRIIDNNADHQISGDIGDGYLEINALASSPDKQDSFNASVVLCDELHTYKSANQYQVLKDATAAYTNKLVIGISSGGRHAGGFCAQHVAYCRKILAGTITGPAADELFVFAAMAPEDAMETDAYLNPEVLEGCNPGWGESIRPMELVNAAQRAHDDPQLRMEFAQKRINLFTAALRAWFDTSIWRKSDMRYDWTREQLARLPIKWYGGTDMARLHDLASPVLFGHYKGVDILFVHCFFPRTAAIAKAEEDKIPLFGWEKDGWLTMSNAEVTDYNDIVQWYIARRSAGFKIQCVGHDSKFSKEYQIAMKKAGFKLRNMPQTDVAQTEGFRYLDRSARKGTLYFCHAEPLLYCVGNVRASERGPNVVHFEKIGEKDRIDVFDASVFACSTYLDDLERNNRNSGWYDEDDAPGA